MHARCVKCNFYEGKPVPTQLSNDAVKSVLMNIPSLNTWGRINGFWLKIFVDTDVSVTTMSWGLWNNIDNWTLTQIKMKNLDKILSANGKNLYALGTLTLSFEINNQIYLDRMWYKD